MAFALAMPGHTPLMHFYINGFCRLQRRLHFPDSFLFHICKCNYTYFTFKGFICQHKHTIIFHLVCIQAHLIPEPATNSPLKAADHSQVKSRVSTKAFRAKRAGAQAPALRISAIYFAYTGAFSGRNCCAGFAFVQSAPHYHGLQALSPAA